MKKVICIITAVILVISFTVITVSATQKVEILEAYCVFDIWQGEGDVSVKITENSFSSVKVKPSEFEALTIEDCKVDDNYFYVTECDGATVITLKESYMLPLEDGCYYMKAEFKTAIITLKLYVIRRASEFSGSDYRFSPWFGSVESTVSFDPPIWPDLFEELTFAGEVVDKENYSLSVFTGRLSLSLSEEYLKTFTPGEYCFSADFVDIKNVPLKLRVFGDNAPGDVNCDGKISANDARIALRASVKLENLSTEQYLAADINNDSHITASDARALLRISVGLEKIEYFIYYTEMRPY